ncbi:MAG: sigma-70 family RNA polymerase sigma factor [Acidobacteria bacterium]|nr:MAG: sigma-70 family RNA polymerase sigma factor [Acidobacteriota bacterium]
MALERPPAPTPEARRSWPALLQRARRGDARAFEGILRRHERRVMATAWRLLGRLEDAQDAAQEVFLRLYRHLEKLDPERPLEPWLYRVTVNVCRDLGRRRQRRRDVHQPLDEAAAARLADGDRAADPAAGLEQEGARSFLARALAGLGEKERAAIVLRDLEGLSTREVARILGASEVTVRTHVCRARRKIKALHQRLTPEDRP